ncbi:BMP family ABC transporter substrate-binding protein [Evansella halocellulosilytica]|uniref:BMP family ABC transporter substrate-binding protein n=1 Tax=Evansella halocellulosilytica TaxID=2011013 RepID=UPI000BB9176B|nr:BMP family ABC transporter substrate-binding protein [Evansella halocellulosilytica]
MQQTNQFHIILFSSIIIAAVIILVILFRTNGILHGPPVIDAQEDQPHVVILTSDEIVDQSWGSMAYKGQLKIEEEFNISTTLYSELDTDERKEDAILEAMSADPTIIIGQGREFSDVFAKLSPTYEDVHFVTLHGSAIHDNQTVYTFDKGNIEYFAALAASMKSESNKIGLLDAIHYEEENRDFQQGIIHFQPDAQFYYGVVESRDDGKRAVQLMEEMIEQGVDVIFSRGNAFNRDVIEHAKNHNVYVIGFIDDQSYMGENVVLTSVLNDISNAYVSIMHDYFSDEGIPPGVVTLDQRHGVFDIAPLGPMFSNEEKEAFESEFLKYQRGELSF